MNAIRTDRCNVVFTAEGCNDLPAAKFKYEDGTPGIETAWELSDEQLEQVKNTRTIYLYVEGETIQPCLLTTESLLVEEA